MENEKMSRYHVVKVLGKNEWWIRDHATPPREDISDAVYLFEQAAIDAIKEIEKVKNES